MTNVAQNRLARKWSRKEQAGRILWALARPLLALSPRPFWGWRRLLLRCFGARIGNQVHIYPSVRIAIPWHLSIDDNAAIGDRAILYCLGPVMVGENATVSQGAHICAGTHDWRDPAMPLLKLPVSIGKRVWICADAFVGPGVSIGDDTIIGARGVVMRDVKAGVIAAGNPLQVLGPRGGDRGK